MAIIDNHTIIGIHITDRLKEAVEVQKLLTEFGDQIKTRLGLHEIEKSPAGSKGPRNGVLLVEMVPPESRIQEFMARLQKIEGVEVKSMIFGH
jgi:hypothetical protein